MNMHLYRRIRCGLIWVLCLMLGLTAVSDITYAADGQNVTQNWSAEAAFYSASCEETETFHMTEEHFLQYKTELEARLILAYSTYYHQLSGEARTALKDAQKMWIDCYYLYIEALEQRWTQPVKIYFGITSKERKTNIYRDYILLMLMNRITDLEEWRLGYVCGPAPIVEQMTKIHQYAIMCAPTTSQYAAVEALRNCGKDVENMRESYNQRRRFLMNEFRKMGLQCFEPFGAFYAFPSIQEFGMTSEEFATRLLQEEKVAVVPGTAFGDCGEGFLRISYAYSLEDLKEAIGRLEKFVRRLRG